MPVSEKIIVDDGIVGLFKMTEAIDELENSYIRRFNEEPPMLNSSHDRRKKEWMSVRLLIAELVGADYSITYLSDGRPQFIHPDYHFISISHSSLYASVYLHKSKNVGIDIESLGRKFSMIEKKYLSEKELEQAKVHPDLKAIYWSCKEAVFKWAGKDGVDFRKQIKIEKFDPERTNMIEAIFAGKIEQAVKLNFLIFDNHVLVYTQ